MKSAFLTAISLLAAAVHCIVVEPESRATDGYVQLPSGTASFTFYSGCDRPACGVPANGFTSAMNQLAFGAPPDVGPGDACGRCFLLTANRDPTSPSFQGPFNSIVVKNTNLCPIQGNEQACGQTTANPVNSFGQDVHFDLCQDTGAAAAFFPAGHGALTGHYQEVSCNEWSGTDGSSLFSGSCLLGENAPLWPSVACGNKGTAP